ncbi:MAG: hypothetical protein U5O15_03685 [Candidatus Krumholzibacteriota bacterium]|nr:hypothetical protein [Candidatus Krumholzibacteriota bacterium]
MDETEKIAKEYIKLKGYKNIEYEPDGNIPPDFLVNGEIAIEVRRLNQNIRTEEGYEGLENAHFPVWERIREHLISYGASKTGESWYVTYWFERPIPDWKTLKAKIERVLLKFRDLGPHKNTEYDINNRFKIKIYRASKEHSKFYLFGGCIDRDACGFVMAKLLNNLDICIKEKTEKIKAYKGQYPYWWLILVDHIDYSMEEIDRKFFQEEAKISHNWDKVILVDPTNPGRSFEI